MMPYFSAGKRADVIASIGVKSVYGGSGWNFLINWPGFLIFTPAWHGYNYKVSHTIDVQLNRGDDSTQFASFSLPVVLNIRHADMNRTWTEIGWLEWGIIPFVGGFVFISYDDNVTPLVAEKVAIPVGTYVAQEIVNRINGYRDLSIRSGVVVENEGGDVTSKPPSVAAASPGKEEAEIPEPSSEVVTVPNIRNVHVLVIGAGKFESEDVPPLTYAEVDARSIYEFLADSDRSVVRKDNVHLLTSEPNVDGLRATRTGISEAVERYLIRRAVNADDLAIIYYAGHGDQDDDGQYYWVPVDAKRGSLMGTAFPRRELDALIAKIPAQNRLLIADACHAGVLSGRRDLVVRTAPIKDVALITSCSESEKSSEWPEKGHGVFTWALVEGLQGNADSACGNGDDRVTLGELQKYLDLRVPSYARKVGATQTPIVKIPEGWKPVYFTR